MESDFELSELRHQLIDRVNSILSKANNFKDSFNKYEYLWVDDRKEFMKKFLKANGASEKNEKQFVPNLEIFREQVSEYFYIFERK